MALVAPQRLCKGRSARRAAPRTSNKSINKSCYGDPQIHNVHVHITFSWVHHTQIHNADKTCRRPWRSPPPHRALNIAPALASQPVSNPPSPVSVMTSKAWSSQSALCIVRRAPHFGNQMTFLPKRHPPWLRYGCPGATKLVAN